MKIVDNYSLNVAYFNERIKYKKEKVNGVLLKIDENDIINNTLIIPNNVSYIEFYNNIKNLNIKKIVLPGTLKSIGKNSFSLLNSLEEIELRNNDNYLNIDFNAFLSCNLKKLKLNKVLNISEGAFANNKKLESIEINELINIEAHVFSYCDNLESVTIMSNPKYDQGSNFERDYNLKRMELGLGYKTSSLYYGIDDKCFDKEDSFSITYIKYLDKNIQEYSINELEDLVINLSRYQFFDIEKYFFTNNGNLSIDNIDDDSFMYEFFNIESMNNKLNKHNFYLKLIFKNGYIIILPIKEYLNCDIIHSENLKQKIKSFQGR